MEHKGEPPKFVFKMVSSHKTALSRQVKEAVRIRRRGGATSILNSRAEFNRCHIPRLVVEEEDDESREQRRVIEEQSSLEITKLMKQVVLTWEERKKREQELLMNKRKRLDSLPEDGAGGGARDKGRSSKRIKLPLIGEDWGEDRGEEELMNVMEPDVCTAPTDPPLNKGRRGSKRSRVSANTLTTPLITDHFTKLPRIMEVVEECEMSPLSPATLSFLVDSSVQADNHEGPGAGQVVEPQPDLGLNMCSLMNKDGEQPQQDSNIIVEQQPALMIGSLTNSWKSVTLWTIWMTMT